MTVRACADHCLLSQLRRRPFTAQKYRLVWFGQKLSGALDELVTIIHSATLRRWIRESKKTNRKRKSASPGCLRTAEDIQKLILKFAKENDWG